MGEWIMPKVSEAYLEEKKTFILKCTNELLEEMPLFHLSMRDIIKKTGFSQGAIYRYYANIDEIFIDLINRIPINYPLEKEVDILLDSKQPATTILTEVILTIGRFVEEVLQTVGGRMFFELLVYYAYDVEKEQTILSRLIFKQSIDYAQSKTIDYFIASIEKEEIQLTIPITSITRFIGVSVDGIIQYAALSSIKNSQEIEELVSETADLFQTLTQSIVHFLK
ncbi:hypothetical protein RV10_GL001740 [Enterococcus pallens]|nr:hypothetical protein RV10_GL001740 [Enterococcus pallens]